MMGLLGLGLLGICLILICSFVYMWLYDVRLGKLGGGRALSLLLDSECQSHTPRHALT